MLLQSGARVPLRIACKSTAEQHVHSKIYHALKPEGRPQTQKVNDKKTRLHKLVLQSDVEYVPAGHYTRTSNKEGQGHTCARAHSPKHVPMRLACLPSLMHAIALNCHAPTFGFDAFVIRKYQMT